jgi:DNA repair photolyase
MIISASRRTDIPAFYGEWFAGRIREGYFIRVNPYNPEQRKRISLERPDVDAIVFWTKYPAAFMKYLALLDAEGYNYYFLYTLNDYPAVFEPGVPGLAARIDAFLQLSAVLGPERVIWRYDPIIISRMTPVEYHCEAFTRLAERLNGSANRVIISFLDIYPKVKRRLERIDPRGELNLLDLREAGEHGRLDLLMTQIGKAASTNSLEIYCCSEKLDLSRYGVQHNGCIDAALLNRLFGTNLSLKRDPAQRQECLCAPAVDMGVYDTCGFHCSYCYANGAERRVAERMKRHDPRGAALG